MAKGKKTPQKTAEKQAGNIAGNDIDEKAVKNSSLEPRIPVVKAKHHQQKTEEERAIFIKSFAGIVKGNDSVRDNYLISFADVDYATQIYITDKDKNDLDLLKLLTKTEHSAYTVLLNKWKN